MHNHFFPPPSAKPFYRLHVEDGLMINAERWKKSQEYHKLRQNIHYQSLNQPGIVYGLGVQTITAPEGIESKYRDGRWLGIQPGLAINLNGNLIIFDEVVSFRLDTPKPTNGNVTVYVVIRYDESGIPELRDNSRYIREWFRIEEQTCPPNSQQIELCRIQFNSDTIVKLEAPEDVFNPCFNEIDLRFRQQAQARPLSFVKVASLNMGTIDDENNAENISYLIKSLPALYPSLQGDSEKLDIGNIDKLPLYDLLYISYQQFSCLQPVIFQKILNFLNTGGVIIIESGENNTADDLKEKLTSDFGISDWQKWEDIASYNPLRTEPFLFGRILEFNIYRASGIILIEGNLSRRWGLEDNYYLSRQEIRQAQELGINILNFAFRQKQMINLLIANG
jgi:hypothetical protein